MGFLSPKVPKPPAPPTTAIVANSQADQPQADGLATAAASLINTGPSGLQRKANTQRTSLIGG